MKPLNSILLITKNAAALFIARIIDAASRLAILAIAARYLGVETFGQFAFIVVAVPLVFRLSSIGMANQIVTRELVQNKAQGGKYLGSALILRLILSASILTILVVIVQFMDLSTETVIAVYAMGFAQFPLMLSDVFMAVFRASEKMEYNTLVSMASQLISFATVASAAYFDLGFVSLFLCFVLGNFVRALSAFFLSSKQFVKPQIDIDTDLWKHFVKSSIPLGLSNFLKEAYLKVDVFALKVLRSSREIALFHAPYSVITRITIFPRSIVMAIFPLLSRLAISSESTLAHTYERIFRFLLIFALPIPVLASLLSRKIVVLLYGDEFAPAAIVLQILVWVIPFLFIVSLHNFVLTAMNKQIFVLISMTICFLTNLILDLILVPQFGYVGASIATLVAYVALILTGLYFVCRQLHIIPLHANLLKPLFSFVVTALFIYLLQEQNVTWVAPGGVLVYVTMLFLTRTYSLKDIRLLKRMMKRGYDAAE